MDYGIKITKEDHDVLTKGMVRKCSNKRKKEAAHILSILALPYLEGAKVQINRYKEATSMLSKNPPQGVMRCLHEASNLFEDVATVCQYLRILDKSLYKKFWVDIRDHIRHDIREEFDINEKRKERRALGLGIPSNLQLVMSFDKDGIKVGSILIKLSDIERFLFNAQKIFEKYISDAKLKGYIK